MSKKNKLSSPLSSRELIWIFLIILVVFAIIVGKAYMTSPVNTAVDARKVEVLAEYAGKTQKFNLSEGWNMISFGVVPDDLLVSEVFSQLVNSGALVMVKNNAGEVYIPDYQIDQIGEISIEEGYQVLMNREAKLVIQGERVELPFGVNLNAGWNLVNYPLSIESDPAVVFADLIEDEFLTLVQDQAGNSYRIENGGWVNEMGMLQPGGGYQVHVTEDTMLLYR